MAKEFNKSNRAAEPPYKQGMFVLLQTPLKGNSAIVLTHRPYGSDLYVIVDVVQNPGFGPAYRLANTKTGKVRFALVPAYRLKPFYSREPITNKYDPNRSVLTGTKAAVTDAKPTAASKPISQAQIQNSSDKYPVKILYQKGDSYLVAYSDNTRKWMMKSPQLDTLLKQWLIKREVSRKKRSETRRHPE